MEHNGPGPYGPHPGMFGPGNDLDLPNRIGNCCYFCLFLFLSIKHCICAMLFEDFKLS